MSDATLPRRIVQITGGHLRAGLAFSLPAAPAPKVDRLAAARLLYRDAERLMADALSVGNTEQAQRAGINFGRARRHLAETSL